MTENQKKKIDVCRENRLTIPEITVSKEHPRDAGIAKAV